MRAQRSSAGRARRLVPIRKRGFTEALGLRGAHQKCLDTDRQHLRFSCVLSLPSLPAPSSVSFPEEFHLKFSLSKNPFHHPFEFKKKKPLKKNTALTEPPQTPARPRPAGPFRSAAATEHPTSGAPKRDSTWAEPEEPVSKPGAHHRAPFERSANEVWERRRRLRAPARHAPPRYRCSQRAPPWPPRRRRSPPPDRPGPASPTSAPQARSPPGAGGQRGTAALRPTPGTRFLRSAPFLPGPYPRPAGRLGSPPPPHPRGRHRRDAAAGAPGPPAPPPPGPLTAAGDWDEPRGTNAPLPPPPQPDDVMRAGRAPVRQRPRRPAGPVPGERRLLRRAVNNAPSARPGQGRARAAARSSVLELHR